MLQTRVIPVLLLKGSGLYKGEKFKNHNYIGDPINTVKLFNEKEVDEIIVLDIDATKKNKAINFSMLEDIANEAFMPFAYGGGIHKLEDVEKLFSLGVEKVVLNSYAIENPEFIKEISSIYGNQSIVISLDVKQNWLGNYKVYGKNGTIKTNIIPSDFAILMQTMGAGEIIINSIDHDGMMAGYDYEIINSLSNILEIPLVALGGAGDIDHFLKARNAGASAVAAGSLFVYHGPHKAVLISYPKYESLCELFKKEKNE